MNWWQALIIGFIQGISEFMPISSTALILLAQRILNVPIGNNSKLAFETFLHIASVLAVIVYFMIYIRSYMISLSMFEPRKNKHKQTTGSCFY